MFLDSQIQKEHSIEDLLIFLIVFLISLLLKPSFSKEHKTDLEQYPLAPTSTAKSSTHQSLDSMIVFKTEYLLILAPCQDSTFSSQGHVSSMRISGTDPERICEFSKFQCEKMLATMVGRRRNALVLDELKQS